jgi:adenine-specific DNA-methyltransferase
VILERPYTKASFNDFLDDFLTDFKKDERPVRTPDKSILTEVTQLGISKEANLTILEAECEETDSKKRIAITQAAFKVLRDHGIRNALIAFHDGADQWRLSLLTSTLELKDGKVVKKDSNPRRYSYLLGIGAKTRTPHKYLVEKGAVTDIKSLQERFSVEVVNKQFYESIAELFTKLVGGERGQTRYPGLLKINGQINQNNENQEFAVRLIGRIIFSWFLKEKKSAAGIPIVPDELLSLSAVASHGDYYHSILEPLFFELLNKRVKDRHEALRQAPFATVPYLNGGLFSPQYDDYYQQNSFTGGGSPGIVSVPDSWFTELFTVLEQYNFTVDENTSYDVDLSIDPEMLGRIFENLLAEINPETGETARKSTGSFYTPREIVDYMVDSSLLEYLKSRTTINENKLRAIISWGQEDDAEHPLNNDESKSIVDALATLTILDPACGSGAFPIGILQKVVYILQQVDDTAEIWLESQLKFVTSPELRRDIEEKYRSENYDWLRKLGVIRESIFGVDIQTIATEIAKLRCFLTLIIEEDVIDERDNRGIRPLPNLDFKFVTANSLLGLPESSRSSQSKALNIFEDSSHIKRLKEIRNRYFGADSDERNRLQVEFKDLQWFDPEWMFGVDSFNIVIANPPYINVFILSKDKQFDKQAYKRNYSSAKGAYDIYVLFFELGINLLSPYGVLSYITPNKYISAEYAQSLRELLFSKKVKPVAIADVSKISVFDAAVYPVVSTFKIQDDINHIDLYEGDRTTDGSISIIKKAELTADTFSWASLLNSKDDWINKIEKHSKLPEFATISASFTVGDSYNIKPYIKSLSSEAVIENKMKKFIISSNIHKYSASWGVKTISYLKERLNQPVINDVDKLPITQDRKMKLAKDKIIIACMTKELRCFLDEQGDYVPGIPTIIITGFKTSSKYLLAVLNSKVIDYYYRYKFDSLSLAGGYLRIGVPQLATLPVPVPDDDVLIKIDRAVEKLLKGEENRDVQMRNIDKLVYDLYGLSADEIKIIENGSNNL